MPTPSGNLQPIIPAGGRSRQTLQRGCNPRRRPRAAPPAGVEEPDELAPTPGAVKPGTAPPRRSAAGLHASGPGGGAGRGRRRQPPPPAVGPGREAPRRAGAANGRPRCAPRSRAPGAVRAAPSASAAMPSGAAQQGEDLGVARAEVQRLPSSQASGSPSSRSRRRCAGGASPGSAPPRPGSRRRADRLGAGRSRRRGGRPPASPGTPTCVPSQPIGLAMTTLPGARHHAGAAGAQVGERGGCSARAAARPAATAPGASTRSPPPAAAVTSARLWGWVIRKRAGQVHRRRAAARAGLEDRRRRAGPAGGPSR